jgi:carbon starvation protein
MTTLLIAIGAFVGYIVAYHTYGRWLARKIFGLDPDAPVPSQQLRDDVDFVPTKKEVIFGHHFTSIAGTGPIVGPAIAVFWGWLPALLWVLFGSIFIGAVHDFGALVVSLRNRGQTVGEVAGRLITPRAKILFLLTLFMALTVVLAIFGLVIALIFAFYPEAVLSVWIEIPLAIAIGYWVYRCGGGLLIPSLVALAIMYIAIYAGVNWFPINLAEILGIPLVGSTLVNVVIVWTVILLSYCFVASVLPVWVLLQPRDYINSHQLVLALGLLFIGLCVAGVTSQASLESSAPAVADDIPPDAPPIWPFLFITIACGAVSGFHCLVSSGTSSKQVSNERDAQYVGYGAMLLEGGLAVIVILACCAGVGMGQLAKNPDTGDYNRKAIAMADGATQRQKDYPVWSAYYPTTRQVTNVDPVTNQSTTVTKGGWSTHQLKHKIAAFIDGGANFLSTLGIPLKYGVAIIAVLVASFAATTLDTATRLQRYVIQELGGAVKVVPLTNKYAATALALVLGGALAMMPGPKGPGTGGLILWPMFGATNQLLAGLAFMVIVFYLWRRSKPILFALAPMLLMLLMPAWAMLWNMFDPETGWWVQQKYLLFSIGVAIMALQIWMVVEAILIWPRAKGVLEEALPPLEPRPAMAGGRSC